MAADGNHFVTNLNLVADNFTHLTDIYNGSLLHKTLKYIKPGNQKKAI